MFQSDSARIGSWEMRLLAPSGNYNRPTNQPTDDRPNDGRRFNSSNLLGSKFAKYTIYFVFQNGIRNLPSQRKAFSSSPQIPKK